MSTFEGTLSDGIQSLRKMVTTVVAAVSAVGVAFVSFQYRSVITDTYWLSDIVFGNVPSISILKFKEGVRWKQAQFSLPLVGVVVPNAKLAVRHSGV